MSEKNLSLINTLAEASDVYPDALVTVKVYVPGISPVMVVLVPVPVIVIPPGILVNVQVPVAGKLFKTTFPVATVDVGCIIVPTMGAVSMHGWVLIVTIVPGEIQPSEIFVALIVTLVIGDIQPAAFLAVTLYEPVTTDVNVPVILVYVEPSIL